MVGKENLAHPLASLVPLVARVPGLCLTTTTQSIIFLPKIVIRSPTGCEKVTFKRQMYDLSENDKICQTKCNILVQTGYSQSVFAEA